LDKKSRFTDKGKKFKNHSRMETHVVTPTARFSFPSGDAPKRSFPLSVIGGGARDLVWQGDARFKNQQESHLLPDIFLSSVSPCHTKSLAPPPDAFLNKASFRGVSARERD